MSHDQKHGGFGDKLLHKLHISGKDKATSPPSAASHATSTQPQARATGTTQAPSAEPAGIVKAPESLPRQPVDPVSNLKAANDAPQAFTSPTGQGAAAGTGSAKTPLGPSTPNLTSHEPTSGVYSQSGPPQVQNRTIDAPLGTLSSPGNGTGGSATALPGAVTSSGLPTGSRIENDASKGISSSGPSPAGLQQQPKQFDSTTQGLKPTGEGAHTSSQPAQFQAGGITNKFQQQQPEGVLQQTQARAAEVTSSAVAGAQQLGELGREKAAQAYNAVAGELDRQGINTASSKQKLADIGQGVKDYSAVGSERAAEYLQQAAHAVKNDEESRGILVRVLGAVVLVWLAFGFSTRAFITLGLVALGGYIVSRLYRKGVAHRTSAQPQTGLGSGQGYGTAQGRPPNTLASAAQGVETHYPLGSRGGAHPDSSVSNPSKAAAATFSS